MDAFDPGGNSSAPPGLGFGLADEDWLTLVRTAEDRGTGGRIGTYELLGDVRRGGQGVVYARDKPETQRLIAVKRMVAGALASPQTRARFEREVRAAAALSHPSIVTVYGVDVVDEQPLLAMEWVAGDPVDRWVRDRRAGLHDVLPLFVRIADAVRHAHQRGVIHRDLKPSNILVTDDGIPKVLDFGLAKVMTPDGAGGDLTITEQFVGTPAYAAPEQVRGAPQQVDVRSDVYSLGVILYELLTGTRPHIAENLPALLNAIQQDAVDRPSVRNRGLDDEIDAMLLTALAQEPGERYQSVDAFVADVERYLADEPLSVRPPTRLYQMRKFARRHRALVLAGAGFVASLIIAVVGTSLGLIEARAQKAEAEFQRGEAQRQRAEAELQRDFAQTQSARAQAVSDFLREMLAGVDPSVALGEDRTLLRNILDETAARLETDLPDQPEVEAAIRETLGRTYSAIGLYFEALPHLETSLDMRRERLGHDAPETTDSAEGLAGLYKSLGRYREARELLEHAAATRAATDGPDDRRTLMARAMLAGVVRALGFLDEAATMYAEVIEDFTRVLGPESPDTILARQNLAFVLQEQGLYEQARTRLEEVLELRSQVDGPRHPGTLIARHNLGQLYTALGRLTESEQLLQDVFADQVEVLGEDHPNVLSTRNSLAHAALTRGDFALARARSEANYAAQVRKLGRDHPSSLATESQLAFLLFQERDYATAEERFDDLIARGEPILGETHNLMLIARNNLAGICLRTGRLEEAREQLLEVLDCTERTYGHNHPRYAGTRHNLAGVQQTLEEYEDALDGFRVAAELREALLGLTHERTIRSYRHAGSVLRTLERYDEAVPVYATIIEAYRRRGPSSVADLADMLVLYGESLMLIDQPAEAEPALREALDLRSARDPESWRTFSAMTLLGMCMTRQDALEDAETLLRAAREGYDTISDAGPTRRRTVRLRLAELYERWDRPEDAEHWRREAAAIE